MFVTTATSRRLLLAAAVLAHISLAKPLYSQTATDRIRLGDSDSRTMNSAGALHHFEAAVAADSKSYEALWKAAREALELGKYNSSATERDRLYTLAELYARRAVEANPGGADGHFELAHALGQRALSVRQRDRVRYASDVRTHALEALRLAPTGFNDPTYQREASSELKKLR